LAARSVNFQKCFVPISSTLESMTSIMSGQFPQTHGLQHMFPNRQQVDHVQHHVPTLASQLGDAGYQTCVMGDWCAGIFDLLPHGFQERDVSTFDNFKVYMTQVVYREHPLLPVFFDNPLGYWLFPGLRSCASFVTPEVVTDRLKQRLTAAAAAEKPFFITTFYSTTHIPYRVNPPYNTRFTDPTYQGDHQDAMALDVGKFISDVNVANKWRALPEKEVAQIVGLYDGCVAKFDDSVKAVVEHLQKVGLAENTIIIVTSDHGDDLFEPNCTFGHGLTFNGGDQNGNVPFILHLPENQGAGQKVQQLVRSIDFAPTLLDLVGIKPDQRIEGVSLRPYVEKPGSDLSLALFAETSYLFCKRYIPNEEPLYMEPMDSSTFVDESFDCHFVLKDKYQDDVLKTKERCLRTQNWKLVFTPGKNKDIWRLFDLRMDLHCERPVNLEHPVVFQAMQNKLLQWMREKKESRISEIFPDGEPSGEIVKK
jgi:arylsulfatase A-like enzyme